MSPSIVPRINLGVVNLGRDLCSDITQATQREWLITNGIGGYGSGTLSGILTRCYHGLLIAALKPPLGRTLLLTKLDETVTYQRTAYPLSCDRWSGGTTTGHGYRHLEHFGLEGTLPTWTYACADALLEKRLWMQPGKNTTYCQYTLRRASSPLTLSIKSIVNYRDHHHTTQSVSNGKEWAIQTKAYPRGLQVAAFEGSVPLYLLSDKGQLLPQNKWYQHYFLTQEKYRGLNHLDDHFHAATLRTTLTPGETLTLVASTEPHPVLNGHAAHAERVAYERALLSTFQPTTTPKTGTTTSTSATPPWIQQLLLAADQFVVNRATPADTESTVTESTITESTVTESTVTESTEPDNTIEPVTGKTVIAGYPWFGDWGRDTMIALPGLTLTTGRPHLAAPILRTFARYLSQGMLPNAFPEANDTPGYNTVDAILWYFEAIHAYIAATHDLNLLQELFGPLKDVIAWHQKGTRYNIQCTEDGLISAGTPGAQLTWMDAKVDDWVVTPRIGKPVEISALWHNALMCMATFADLLGEPKSDYIKLAQHTNNSFQKFWNTATGHCYDVLDGPNGHDPALRPNQIFAVSLTHGPNLSVQQKKGIVDTCAQQLLTSHGLRSLNPDHPDYIGVYGGDRTKRDGAYHQGTTWGWLIGPFIQAHLKVYKDPELARTFLTPFSQHLSAGCVGTLSEIFDGNAPFASRGAFAQAWSVSEVLKAWALVEKSEG
ncbi:MAG: amylo-alpha-1,6-glucosidase [Cyanobacteria bacterium J06598_3]